MIGLLKYFPSISAFLLGLIMFLASGTIELPSEEQLTKATGNLVSVKSVPIGKSSLTMFKIEGQDTLFSYSSMGRSCGYVYDKLVETQGKNISVKFDSHDLIKASNLPNFYKVYDIWSGSYPICTYWDIRKMYEKEHGIGIYFGLGVMLLSILSILKKSLTPHSSGTPNGVP